MPELMTAIHPPGVRCRLSGRNIFPRSTDAITVERQLKGWSRAKKEALVKGDWGE